MTVHLRSGPHPRPCRATFAARFAVAALSCTLVACGGDDGGDLATFCEGVADLEANDPFAELDIASPGEMRDAFAALAEQVDRVAAAAPDEVRTQAERYAASVQALRDELAGAAYDPTRVDHLEYGQAVAAYTEAAVSVDNAADARC